MAARVLVLALIAACAEHRDISVPCGSDCGAHVHPPGIMDPASDAFHGKELARRDWSFALCQGCHGVDYAGGASGVSCLTCHPQGPTACVTCHGANGPTSNAHPTHAGAQLDCGECHVVPASWDAPGHIVGVDLSQPVPVVLGARANLTIDPADRAAPAAWDGARCTNVYCHGAALGNSGGTLVAPRWDDPTPPGGCATCHGQPPPSHQRSDCATCHPPNAPHLDGVVQIGRAPGCSGCHGSATSPAPPVDLAGNTAITSIGVGAHQAHLTSSFLRGPIACATCHVVPQTIADAGHLAPAPAAVTIAWDRGTRTCASWCHMGQSPAWTTSGTAYCGSCHGIPPNGPMHAPTMTPFDCHTCHSLSIDAQGNPIVNADGTSHHIDGVIDVD